MTPSQLLSRIEDLGVVSDKYLDRIRKQIENPEKVVKIKAVVKYLLQKEQINKKQAKMLLEPPAEGEFTVAPAPVENDFDSSALLGEEIVAPEVETPAVIMPEVAEVEPIAEVDPIVEVEPVALDPIIEPIIDDATIMDAGQFTAAADDAFDVQPHADLDAFGVAADPPPAAEKAAYTSDAINAFKGKRDQKDQFKTKWLFIGFGLLALIIGGVFLLSIIVFGQNAEKMLEAANYSYDKQNWGDAEIKFEEFIEAAPSHKDVPVARAKKVNALLRGKFAARSYEEMIQQADLKLAPLAEEEDTKISVIREDLSVILPRGLYQITEKAAQAMITGDNTDIAQMEKDLAKINQLKKVIDNPVYIPGGPRKVPSTADTLSKIDNNIRTIAGLIGKETDYKAALVEIEKLRVASKTDEAFNEYRKLTRNHPDVAVRKPLVELMLAISKKESQLVKPIRIDVQPQAVARKSLIDSTVVLSSKSGGKVESLEGEIVSFVVDGSAYGFDAGNGKLVWRRFVGQETILSPVTLDQTHTLIADQRNNDLLCVKTQTGELVWRQEFGEKFRSPAVGPDAKILVVSTDSGRVIELDALTGAIQKAVQLPQATGPAALIGSRDPIIYQVGRYSNIYALDRQSYQCREVYSLGHYQGAVAIPPVQWSGFLLVAVNGGDYCDIHVLKPQKNGLDLKRVQYLPRVLEAPTSTPFVKAGRSYLVVGDNSEVHMLGIDPTNETAPIESQSRELLGEKDGPRPQLSASGSNVWMASDGIVHARIRRNQGKIERDAAEQAGDHFLMAAQKLDDYVFHVRRRNGSGMLSASLAEARKLASVWRNDFGGQLAGSPVVSDDAVTAISNEGGLFTITDQDLQKGMAASPVRSSNVIENLQFSHVVDFDGKFAAVGPEGKADLLFVDEGQSKLMQLAPPANKPTGRPLRIGDQLVIASNTGYIARLNPANGRLVGTPFQTPITPESVINWLAPIQVGEDMIAAAIGESKGETSKLFLLSTSNKSRIEPVSELVSEAPFKGELLRLGDGILAVVAGKVDQLILIGGNPLAKQRTVDLAGTLVAGPWKIDNGIVVKLDDDKLYCFSDDLAAKWSIAVPNDRLAAEPQAFGDQLMLCFQSGAVGFVDPATGQSTGGFDVGQPVVHRPTRDGQKLYFSGTDGTVHVVDLDNLSPQ
jgi:outer membrane protein assembly factor BamB